VRAVLDPNVVISGLLSPAGSPAELLRAWREGYFEAVASPLLLAELTRALAYPKLRRHIPAADAKTAVDWLQSGAVLADDPSEPPTVRSEDPGDDDVIALAEHRRAAIVSGDRHLLALRPQIPVYSPRDFLVVVSY
jgi:putative PIN family toxin of toxin-antitoxin system